ncbi:MAG TPA: MFS transporter [Solirubrobacteraceae bacterium]
MRLRGEGGEGGDGALTAIVAEGFLSRLSFGVLNVALPLYARNELGMSFGQIGLLISLNTIVAILFKPVMGALADRFGLKLSLNVAVILRSAVTLLLAIATVPWQLFAARSVHGVSIALRDPVVGAMIAEHGGKKKIAQAFAWYQTAKSVAGNAGKALAPALLVAFHSDYTIVFLTAFALSALPIAVVVLFVQEPPKAAQVSVVDLEAQEKQAHEQAKKSTGVPRQAIASFMGLGFVVSATANMLSGLFPLIVTEYAGLSETVLSLMYVVGTAAAFTGPVFGWLADHAGNKVVLSLRSAANIFSSLLYIITPTVLGIAFGKALDDMGKAAFKPAWGAMMAELSSMDKRRRARMFGYMTAGEDTGEIVAPIFAGFLASGWGIPVMLGARIVIAALAEVYTVVVTRVYLEPGVERPPRRRRRVALPVRLAAGVLAGFGTGWGIGELQEHSASAASEQPAATAGPYAVAISDSGSDRGPRGRVMSP